MELQWINTKSIIKPPPRARGAGGGYFYLSQASRAGPPLCPQGSTSVFMCIIAGFDEGLQPSPPSLATIAESRPNVLSWLFNADRCYRCLYHTNSANQFQWETESTPCPGHRAQVSSGNQPLPPWLNWQSWYLLIEVASDSSSMCAGTFGGWTLREVMRMLRRADARACTELSSAPSSMFGVYSSTRVLCVFPLSLAKRINLNVSSFHYLFFSSFLLDCLYLTCS